MVPATKIITEYNAKVICFVVYGQQPSASSQNMTGAVGIASLVKQLTNTPVVFVGGHVAALPQEVLLEDPEDLENTRILQDYKGNVINPKNLAAPSTLMLLSNINKIEKTSKKPVSKTVQ